MLDKDIIVLHARDNVATALIDLTAGEYVFGDNQTRIQIREEIKAGFKIAIANIDAQKPILKYGHVIGHAKTAISIGDCVHIHNLISSV